MDRVSMGSDRISRPERGGWNRPHFSLSSAAGSDGHRGLPSAPHRLLHHWNWLRVGGSKVLWMIRARASWPNQETRTPRPISKLGRSSPSSLSLYWSEFVLPFWLLSALGRTVTSAGASASGGWSKSFCSFFSYNLRVEAEWIFFLKKCKILHSLQFNVKSIDF